MERMPARKRVTRTAPRLRRQIIEEAEPTVRRMFAEGATDRQIMTALNMPSITHVQTVRCCRRHYGLTRAHVYHPITEAEVATVVPLIDEGLSVADIARRAGMTATRLRNLFLKYGLGSFEKKPSKIPHNDANRWAVALGGRAFPSFDDRELPPHDSAQFRHSRPVTHIETQSTAAMAAL